MINNYLTHLSNNFPIKKLRNKIKVFTFVGAFWPDPVLVLGRSTVVGDSGDVFTGVVAI